MLHDKKHIILICIVILSTIPLALAAQTTVSTEVGGLETVLDSVYAQMLPLCSSLIGVGQGIAGFAALWYIAYRVWRHLASAEPIDFYPLFRPFVTGIAILLFPSVIALFNGVLQPTVSATASMVTGSDAAIAALLTQEQQAVQNSDFYKMYIGPDGNGDRDKWYQYEHPDDPSDQNEGMFESIGNDIKFAMAKMSYNFRNGIKEWMSEVLQLLYEAAALCINTIRTFYLVVLAILGPLVLGISIFDGLHHTLTAWIARYINVFLWLPVANIFGSIIGQVQRHMLQLDINQIQANGDTYFGPTDTAYLVFLIIGIIGYFTVPSVANYVVQAGGGGNLLYRTTALFNAGTRSVLAASGGMVNTMVDSGVDGGGGSGAAGGAGRSSRSGDYDGEGTLASRISGKTNN